VVSLVPAISAISKRETKKSRFGTRNGEERNT